MDRRPTTDSGVLAVVMSDPEVEAVFPELSSTILPHSQEIRFYRGDSVDIAVQLQNDGDPPDPVSLDNAVLRFAAKQGHGGVPTSLRNRVVLGNEAALIVKCSYDPLEIEIFQSSAGRAIVHLDRDDTHLLPSVPAVWDLEVTRPAGEIVIPDGQVLFTPGDDVVLSATPSLDWTALRLKAGDLFLAQGRVVLVRAVISSQHLRLDWADWTPGLLPSSSMRAWRGRTKTTAHGSFVALGDVVR